MTRLPMISFAQLRGTLYVMAAALVVTLATISTSGAQTATTPELQAAIDAVARAGAADADQYAHDTIESARQLLRQAQAAQANRDKREAEDFALRAAVEADLARARSEEATANANLAHRQQEVAALKQKLGLEQTP